MATRMKQRRGTAAQWISTNSGQGPILEAGEIGYESDTNKFKIGDGTNHWNDLPYFLDEITLGTSLDGYIPDSLLGAANGVAQLNSSGKLVSEQIPNVDEITQDAINTALVAGTGLDKTYDDNANTITIDIDSTVATKDFAAELLTNATKTNVTITGDKNGLTITAENGVADSNTDNLAEGSTNKYFTDERAQDAVGNALGNGLKYTDSSGAIEPDLALSGGLYIDNSDKLAVDGYYVTFNGAQQTLTNKTLTSPKINEDVALTATATELNYIDGVTSSIQDQLDDKMPLSGGTFSGTVYGTSLELSGDLTVDGTFSSVPTETLTVTNPMIYMGDGNPANINDLGLVGSHTISGTYSHTGLVKDATDGKWKLFTGVTDEPTTTVNFSQATLDALKVGAFEADSITVGDVSNAEIGYLDGVTSAIQTQLDNKAPLDSPTFSGTTLIQGNLTIQAGGQNTLKFPDKVQDSMGAYAEAGKVLGKGQFGAAWVTAVQAGIYPSLDAGKYLTTDGTNVSWATVEALPSQSGNTGKYLTTNGSSASWAPNPAPTINAMFMIGGV